MVSTHQIVIGLCLVSFGGLKLCPCPPRVVAGQYHPIESPELIARKLIEFQVEVDKIPTDEKQCLLMAEKRCPDLLTDELKLMFLRCDVFHARLAALRYVEYWNKRCELFGDPLAFEPLCLDTHLNSPADQTALATGLFNLFEVNGRVVSFERLHTYRLDQTTRESYMKIVFYLSHVALENEETQKRGIIVFSYPRGVDLAKQKDLKMLRLASTLKGAIPVRLSAYHCCHPPHWLRFFLPLVRLLLGKKLSQRLIFHTGSDDDVLAILKRKYGFCPEDLPVEIGGERLLDMTPFYEARRAAGM